MNLSELNNLDFSNMGNWPAPAKAVLMLLLAAAIGGAWYYFDTREQFAVLERYQKEEGALRSEFLVKQDKVLNLEIYKKQLEEMKLDFAEMLRQLPDKREIADLLVDVSQTGLAAGLEFELFQPLSELEKDFYVELPIKIKVVGDYHEFGDFVSGLAALPRIITMHDIKITKTGKRADLLLETTAKTYRYIGDGGEQ
ncbi:MAG: type 4a pilus biogenesis protein PilO [Pseudomonadota bacterium]|nr:type 4a pilus biogenesis protein PilO [Pseudomonadota bacterium]